MKKYNKIISFILIILLLISSVNISVFAEDEEITETSTNLSNDEIIIDDENDELSNDEQISESEDIDMTKYISAIINDSEALVKIMTNEDNELIDIRNYLNNIKIYYAYDIEVESSASEYHVVLKDINIPDGVKSFDNIQLLHFSKGWKSDNSKIENINFEYKSNNVIFDVDSLSPFIFIEKQVQEEIDTPEQTEEPIDEQSSESIETPEVSETQESIDDPIEEPENPDKVDDDNTEQEETSDPVKEPEKDTTESENENKEELDENEIIKIYNKYTFDFNNPNIFNKKSRNSSVIEFTFNSGEGTFSDGSTENIVHFSQDYEKVFYLHTANIDDAGNNTGTYQNSLQQVDEINCPGASSIDIDVIFSTEAIYYDWLAIYPEGITPTASNYSLATISNGRLGGHGNLGSMDKPSYDDPNLHKTFHYEGDNATFFFRSDSSGAYYGYYAVVTAHGTISESDKYEIPQKSGKVFKGWHLEEDLSDDSILKINYSQYSENTTFYAEFGDPDFQISMIYYDSDVDNGHTALNSSTPCEKYYNTTSDYKGNLILQINYTADDLQKDYAPGELTFKVYGLEKFGLKNPQIPRDLFNVEHHTGTYNSETNTVENDYWIFTNKALIPSGGSTEGMVQMVYSIGLWSGSNSSTPIAGSSGDVYIEYENSTWSNIQFSFDAAKASYTLSRPISASNTVYESTYFTNDYYWASFSSLSTGLNSNKPLKFIKRTVHYDISLPSGLKVYVYDSNDSTMHIAEEIPNGDGTSIYRVPYVYSGSIYVGYPKNEYNIGDEVSIDSINLYGFYSTQGMSYENTNISGYPFPNEELLFSTYSRTTTLKDFQVIAGDLLSWNYYDYQTYNSLSPSTISNESKRGIYGTRSNITIHNEVPIDVIYGWDSIVAIEGESDYILLEDLEIYLSNRYGPYIFHRILDANNIPLQEGTCDIEVYIKEYGNTDYQLYKSAVNGSNNDTISIGSKKVTAYYVKIKNLPAGKWTLNQQQSCQTASIYKEYGTYKQDGFVLDSAYLMLYTIDGTCLTQPSSETEYPIELQNLGIPVNDLNTYGQYMNRQIVKQTIKPDKYVGKSGIATINASHHDSQTDYLIDVRAGIKNSETGTKFINGYDFYFTLPIIATTNTSKIISKTLEYFSSNSGQYFDVSVGNQVEWVQDYINRSTITSTVINNENFIHIHIDYDNLDISNLNGMIWRFMIPITVYDADILDYGGVVDSILYNSPVLPLGNELSYDSGGNVTNNNNNYFYNIKEESYYGQLKTDSSDIDGDGNTTEKFLYNHCYGNLVPAFNAQQDFSKLVKTENNNWKTGATYVLSGHAYSYRLRARTAATGMTNLVLYDFIETYSPVGVDHWQGIYTGIDLTRSESQGHVPTVYYSTSQSPGKLGEDSSWTLYTSSVDISTVRSLAFDYGSQIIQPNSIVSVDITVQAPEFDSELYAYNIYKATWNRVDAATGTILPGDQEMDSGVTVVALNDPIDDIKDITITKIWDDNNNEYELRPSQITVKLLKDNEELQTVILKASENWTKTIYGLQWFDDTGREYEYTIEEIAVIGYTTEINEYEITNHIIPKKNVIISKLDAQTNQNLAGAHLQVLDSTGTVLDDWTSTTEAHTVEQLAIDATYTIHEVSAPTGYYTFTDITFRIDSSSNIYIIYNDTTEQQIDSINVYNYRRVVLPGTGSDMSIIISISGLLIILFGIFIVLKKRKLYNE